VDPHNLGYGGRLVFLPTYWACGGHKKTTRLYPSMELMRFANSGTEAIASAIRVARTATGRSKIILFEGHYHGWSDAVFHRYHAPLEQLPDWPFGPAPSGTGGMLGAPHEALLVPWNDLEALHACLEAHGDQVAAILMEPVMGNSGAILPEPGYLQGVRAATHEHGALLVFDEVITGLRIAPGGAQEHFLVSPDITVLSKALGGGYPLAAFGASREIMDVIVQGQTFHGGVYSGNAVGMAAAEAVLDEILNNQEQMYRHLYEVGERLADGLREILTRLGVPHVVQGLGPILSLFLTRTDVPKLTNYREVRRNCVFEDYIRLQHFLQQSGVYIHPNQFEMMFLSTAHDPEHIDLALERFDQGVQACLI
jgi:glutamate-1-semialdehyde 2,1-aminomutase